ncbi:MAG: hypothetical protein ACTHMZ_00125 [Actinomycetes bacterium]
MRSNDRWTNEHVTPGQDPREIDRERSEPEAVERILVEGHLQHADQDTSGDGGEMGTSSSTRDPFPRDERPGDAHDATVDTQAERGRPVDPDGDISPVPGAFQVEDTASAHDPTTRQQGPYAAEHARGDLTDAAPAGTREHAEAAGLRGEVPGEPDVSDGRFEQPRSTAQVARQQTVEQDQGDVGDESQEKLLRSSDDD